MVSLSIVCKKTPIVKYVPNENKTIDGLFSEIPHEKDGNDAIIFTGSNAIDFLSSEYGSKFMMDVLDWKVPICNVTLCHPGAVIPCKTRESDVGYDLTIVEVYKQVNSAVTLYRTGVKIQVDSGYYAEVLPRSSIIKTGYMLANSVGIIDNPYNGEIFIALAKIAPEVEPIELPFRGFQLIFRKQKHVQINMVNDLKETLRGTGGFGSTGK